MDVTEWLLDADPSIRWQVMRDVTGASADAIAAERSRVAREGWGARLLSLQGDDGRWGGGTYSPKWVSTTYTLLLLRLLGLDPESSEAGRAIERVREGVTWEGRGGKPFFGGERETCVNSMVLVLGAYFRQPGPLLDALLERLLGEQLEDGGWNCQAPRRSHRASFNTTILALEAMLEVERSIGPDPAIAAARARGEAYLLERRLFRSRSTGEVIRPSWTRFSFPPQWHYDVLRALEYFRAAGAEPDERCDEAIGLVHGRRRADGRWPLQHTHPGLRHFEMEDGDGKPSRWNTLRALRVLAWHEGGSGIASR
ncbi:hypothetical protein [Agromyces bracchium]|uniref:Squalene cyclase C-terminal domain-containing protein n=1 Tax=Agromyces bracchium TaxID=88376 RepID=A0A6I3M1N3_9MICO|nr:hypothetical protein [Agromyces bracchium]MTH66818.1 hypothetical protein [Agromyces bracchium]